MPTVMPAPLLHAHSAVKGKLASAHCLPTSGSVGSGTVVVVVVVAAASSSASPYDGASTATTSRRWAVASATWTAWSSGASMLEGRPWSSTATTVTESSPACAACWTASLAAVVISALPVSAGALGSGAAGAGAAAADDWLDGAGTVHACLGGSVVVETGGPGGGAGGPQAATASAPTTAIVATNRVEVLDLLSAEMVRREDLDGTEEEAAAEAGPLTGSSSGDPSSDEPSRGRRRPRRRPISTMSRPPRPHPERGYGPSPAARHRHR